MRKARVFGQVLGVPGMVIEDVTVQTDLDGDEEILVVSVRPDARSAGRCATCRRRCPGYDVGVGTRRWRTVDTGTTRTFLQAAAPRVQCPEHGVLVAHVPWDSRATSALARSNSTSRAEAATPGFAAANAASAPSLVTVRIRRIVLRSTC